MQIPASCQTWESLMDADSETKMILDNVRADNCIPVHIERSFFANLASMNHPKSSYQAKMNACKVAWDDPQTFLCQGKEVPAHRFQTMLRVYKTDDILKRIKVRKMQTGINRKTLKRRSLTPNEKQELINNYTGALQLAKNNQIIWSSETNNLQQIGSHTEDLIKRLGINHFETERNCVICVYERQFINSTLHVPRSLDVLDQPNFAIEPRCDAESGTTKPIGNENIAGMPEAVHHNCSVPSVRLEYRKLS